VLFLLIHLTLKIVISKNQATPSSCHHRGNEEKKQKKNQNQNPILYIHFNVGGNDKKKEKASVFGHFDTYKKTVIVSLSHFT